MSDYDASGFEGFAYYGSSSGESKTSTITAESRLQKMRRLAGVVDSERIEECMKTLSTASILITGGVGYSGSWTPQAEAWSFLSTNLPLSKWLELALDAQTTPMMRAYCAKAIQTKGLTEDADFDMAFKLLEQSINLDVMINTQSGCIISSHSLGSIIQLALLQACPPSERPSFADRIIEQFVASRSDPNMLTLRLYLPFLSPSKIDLLTKLPKSQRSDGLLLLHRLRLAPAAVSIEEIDDCLAFLTGDIEKPPLEVVKDALEILTLRPSKPLLLSLIARAPTLKSYPLLREIPAIAIQLLYDNDIVDALLDVQSVLESQANSKSRMEAFWSFLTPQILQKKKPTTLEESVIAWFRSQSRENRQKFLHMAKPRVPNDMVERIEQIEASRLNFLRIVERLWLDFNISVPRNLDILFEEKSDDAKICAIIQERLRSRFALYEEHSHEAYLKALQRHLSHSEWLSLLADILPLLTTYNVSATLKFVSATADGSNEVIEALFTAFRATDNGHVLTPIATKLIEFRKPDVVRRLEEILTQRCKANELSWSGWGAQGIFEQINAAKQSK